MTNSPLRSTMNISIGSFQMQARYHAECCTKDQVGHTGKHLHLYRIEKKNLNSNLQNAVSPKTFCYRHRGVCPLPTWFWASVRRPRENHSNVGPHNKILQPYNTLLIPAPFNRTKNEEIEIISCNFFISLDEENAEHMFIIKQLRHWSQIKFHSRFCKLNKNT